MAYRHWTAIKIIFSYQPDNASSPVTSFIFTSFIIFFGIIYFAFILISSRSRMQFGSVSSVPVRTEPDAWRNQDFHKAVSFGKRAFAAKKFCLISPLLFRTLLSLLQLNYRFFVF